MRFKKTVAVAVLLAGTALFPGCRSMGSGAGNGALIGGLLGAGTGAVVGHNRGQRGAYALGGAAIGALGGYLVGDQMDHRDADLRRGPETIDGSDRSRYVRRERVIVREECDPYPPGW